jgi:hypothetical protein
LFAIFLKSNRQFAAQNVSTEFAARPKSQVRDEDDLPFASGFVVCHVSKVEYAFAGLKVTEKFAVRQVSQGVVGHPATTRAL